MFCNKCDDRIGELEETILQLRRQLGLDPEHERLIKLRSLGITKIQSQLINFLYNRKRMITYDDFHVFFSNIDGDAHTEDYLRMLICRCRSILGKNAITSIRGEGYVLSKEGRKALDDLFTTPDP